MRKYEDVECTTCGARVHERCRSLYQSHGMSWPVLKPHASRRHDSEALAALKADPAT